MKVKHFLTIAVVLLFSTAAFSQVSVTMCDRPLEPMVTNVTSSSALFNWIPAAGTDTWVIEVGIQGFTPGMGEYLTKAMVQATYPSLSNFQSFKIRGLGPLKTYDVYIRTECPYMLEQWVGPVDFTTLPAALEPKK
ncbi:MAG: hypothetical protein Kow00127_24670 [Bacteroidales bacterium]